MSKSAQGNLAVVLGASEERADASRVLAAKLRGCFDRS